MADGDERGGSGPRCAVVAIGRNEGERLVRCFESIGHAYPAVYVDSGSTDNSVGEARRRNIDVVALDISIPFTAARARNAGWQRLVAAHPGLDYIQFVDGDCEFAPDWIARAIAVLDAEPTLCAVFGRRRERVPEASIYNALCDDEWDVPVGLVEACGGDVLFRLDALRQVEGYNESLIAGEEPDLCLRLGQQGWQIRRIDAEMTLHDAAIYRAGQMWKRMKRGGHAFAEHVAIHGDAAFADWRKQVRSTAAWALVLPLVILAFALLTLVTPWAALAALALAALYPLQIARLTLRKRREGASLRFAFFHALWLVLGKFAQLGGMARYWLNRAKRQRSSLIEYKASEP